MNAETDYYAVLGVMPNAEQVVIVAAYRALASQYHPDKWKGEALAANSRMSEINLAYGVLGDNEKRRAYDANRPSRHSTFYKYDDVQDEAFDAALSRLEKSWFIAIDIYPDLVTIRKKLSKVSHKLAFAYVTMILEEKKFSNRSEIANTMEAEFLSRHFGDNQKIVNFARQLINLGMRDAIKKLNQYIDVLGDDIQADTLIAKISSAYNIPRNEPNTTTRARRKYEASIDDVLYARNQVRNDRDFKLALWLANVHGYKVDKVGNILNRLFVVSDMRNDSVTPLSFKEDQFITWVIDNLA